MRTLGKSILFFLMTLGVYCLQAQTNVPPGVNYQGVARNASGTLLSNQAITIKIGIRSGAINGILEWEETHAVTTNPFGLFNVVIGKGTSTGGGTINNFSLIPWSSAEHFLITAIDFSGGSLYTPVDTVKFWSVPYAFHSNTAEHLNQPIELNDLKDVDATGVTTGNVLKWDGTDWKPAPDNNSDTANYAFNAQNSTHADTAIFANHILSFPDSVKFAYHTDTAKYALNSKSAENANHSDYCDTAVYALNIGNVPAGWHLNGNSGTTPATHFIGTIDKQDFVIRTNNAERLRILSDGKIGIGTAAPLASLHIKGIDGFLETGTYGTGTPLAPGAGTRMHWYPVKSAFRTGTVTSSQWDDVRIGIYSFAGGYNTTALGSYSTAFGNLCSSTGTCSVSMGYACLSNGTTSVALGNASEARGHFSVAFGRGNIASDTNATAIGYHSTASGKYAMALGGTVVASGEYSMAMGYYANTNKKRGSFVFADASSTNQTLSTADNQFMARTSGGAIFYSSADMLAGVSLPAGGGSWSSLSDKSRKQNFETIDLEKILQGIEHIEVSKWNYKTQPASVKHIGPMAQDLYQQFGFGESETTITNVDIDGINLAAIKALAKRAKALQESADELIHLKAKIELLEKEKKSLEKRIERMERNLSLKD